MEFIAGREVGARQRLDIVTGASQRAQDARADVLGAVMAIDFRLESAHIQAR